MFAHKLMASFLKKTSLTLFPSLLSSKTDVFVERVPPELCCQQKLLRRKTTRGDNSIGTFIWLAVGHRNPHSWGKSRDNASGRVRQRTGDEELCVATLWSHSQTEECRCNLIGSLQPKLWCSVFEKKKRKENPRQQHQFSLLLLASNPSEAKASNYCMNYSYLVHIIWNLFFFTS